MSTDTIFALASGAGRAGVSVFRLSGPQAKDALYALTGGQIPPPRNAVLRVLRDPKSGEMLDRALVLFFQAPHSFTGEDVVELHTHGGRAVAQALTESLRHIPGVRLAEPGEFSRRAFHQGKMDLTMAEAIADLVDAETAAQRRQALRQMEGELGRLYEQWRQRLIKALAYTEAMLDFPDEDLPESVAAQIRTDLDSLYDSLRHHLADKRGERLRDGFSIAIVGAPNAGKSSLLNALARREAAIVSAQAGTTRDVIEVHLSLGDYPVIVADTAGLRESADAIESEGIRRALARASHADLKLAVFDVTEAPDPATLSLLDDQTVVVLNKIDQLPAPATIKGHAAWPLSTTTGAGLKELLQELEKRVRDSLEGQGGGVPLTRERHRAALEECASALDRARHAPLRELTAEDLRLAMRALGRVTGRVDVEDVLDIIFRDFCIGK